MFFCDTSLKRNEWVPQWREEDTPSLSVLILDHSNVPVS